MVLFPAPAGPSMATTMCFCIVSAKNQDNKWRTGERGMGVGRGMPSTLPPPADQFFDVSSKACRFESDLGSQISKLQPGFETEYCRLIYWDRRDPSGENAEI